MLLPDGRGRLEAGSSCGDAGAESFIELVKGAPHALSVSAAGSLSHEVADSLH